MKRTGLLIALIGLALALAACGTSPTATPGATATPVASGTPGAGPTATPAGEPGRDLAAYFQGARITMVTGSAAGGGFDLFLRAFATHAGKYLPGTPASIIVQNITGGGGERGLRHFLDQRPDGYTVGQINPNFWMRSALGDPVPGFDHRTVRIIGSPSGGYQEKLTCIRSSVATNWNEVMQLNRPVTQGDTTGTGVDAFPFVFMEYLGVPNVRTVSGYEGTSDVLAAFRRGEIDVTGNCVEGNIDRLYPEMLENREVAPLVWYMEYPEMQLSTLGDWDEPIFVLDAIEAAGVSITDMQKEVFDLRTAWGAVFSRSYALPAGTPDDIVDAWREAFRGVNSDPAYLEQMEALGYGPVVLGTYGDEMIDTLERTEALFDQHPEAIEIMKDLVGL